MFRVLDCTGEMTSSKGEAREDICCARAGKADIHLEHRIVNLYDMIVIATLQPCNRRSLTTT
jgi:hypothetical protein